MWLFFYTFMSCSLLVNVYPATCLVKLKPCHVVYTHTLSLYSSAPSRANNKGPLLNNFSLYSHCSYFPAPHSAGIAPTPCHAPRTIPIAMDRQALSPPTSALLCAAARNALSSLLSSEYL